MVLTVSSIKWFDPDERFIFIKHVTSLKSRTRGKLSNQDFNGI